MSTMTAPGSAPLELGLRTLGEARELDGCATSQHSALLLYRSALILLLSARQARNEEPPVAPANLWTALEPLPELKKAVSELTLAQVPVIIATLTSEVPELQALSLSRDQLEQSKRGLRALALALGEQLATEAYGARRQRIARRLRIAALVLGVVLPLGWFLLRSPNLALNRPVEVSSRSVAFGVDPRRVVDG